MHGARSPILKTLAVGATALAAAMALGACGSSTAARAVATSAPPAAMAATTVPAGTTAPAAMAATTAPAAATATSASAAASAAPAAVTVADFAFAPATLTVKAGTAVVWTNKDAFAHSVRSADGAFGEQPLKAGQTATVTFAKPGTYAYLCGIHNSMTGTVVVTA